LGPVPLATETLWQTAKCYLAILKMDGSLVYGGWLFLKSDSPWLSPNSDSFNNHYVVQCSNPVVQTNAAEPIISM